MVETYPQSSTKERGTTKAIYLAIFFLREIFIYDKVLPEFNKFEQSKGVTIETCFTEHPKCYGFIDVEPYESVFLEDLSVRDFRTIDRYTEEVSAEHVYLVMRALGKFHAISFALKDQQPEKFHNISSKCTEVIFIPETESSKEIFNQPIHILYEALSGEENANLLAKVKRIFEKATPFDVTVDTLNQARTSDAAVITHSDTWQNNLMFRYDEHGKPIEICFLDWQVTRLSSPIIDLTHFMFVSTTKELRDVHYDNFLKVYYDSLSAHIRRLGSNPEQLFPYALMQEQFRKFTKYSLVLATLMLQVMTADKSNGVNLDELSGNENDTDIFGGFRSSDSRHKLHKRLQNVVADMVRLDYL